MGKKKGDYYDQILKDSTTAGKVLAELCRVKDQRIEELKQEIMAERVKKEVEPRPEV